MCLLNPLLLEAKIDTLKKVPFFYCGFSHISQIFHKARWYLRERESETIKKACRDLLTLFEWHLSQKKISLQDNLNSAILSYDKSLSGFVDVKSYVDEKVDNIHSAYSSDAVLLKTIVDTYIEYDSVADIDVITVNLSNFEFYAVLALFKLSKLIDALNEHQQEINNQCSKDSSFMLSNSLSDAIQYGYAGQAAINYADREYEKTQALFLVDKKQSIKDLRTEMAKLGVNRRLGAGHELRRQYVYQLYSQQHFKSRRQAALELVNPLNDYIEKNELPTLKAGSEYETLYKWLSDYDKQEKATSV